MKKNLFYLMLFIGVFSFAQNDTAEFERMVEAERKAASSIQAFAANPNTANYDITYHELRFTVDPTENFIIGKVTSTFKALAAMNSVTFDLSYELSVSSVKLSGSSFTFVQNTNKKKIIN